MSLRTFFAASALCSVAFASSIASAQDDNAIFADEIKVGEALPGSFLVKPDGDGPFPVIIVLGGSEGSDSAARGFTSKFVEQGYAVFGLPYVGPPEGREGHIPGLPNAFQEIAVDNLAVARAWLAARDDIRAEDIGIYGVSKGAEMGLLAGSYIDGFAAIAAIATSDVVWEGWGSQRKTGSFSWQGEALPWVPYEGMGAEFQNPTGPNGRPRLRLPHDKGRNANPQAAVDARIRVENIDEPVLVAGGDADLVWNSGEMAQNIAERRAEAGLTTVSLVFTDAGHYLSGDGSRETRNPANGEAQKVIWPATLKFFEDHLKD